MARYLFMRKLLNHFHRHEKRLQLQIKQLNEIQHEIKESLFCYARALSKLRNSDNDLNAHYKVIIPAMAELQRKKSANSYLLDELFHELAGVRGNIRQLSEAKRRNKQY